MLLVTAAAGAATGLGALPTLFGARVSHRTYDAALGLAAGVMIAASVFGLIVPGLELGTLPEVMAGVLAGGFGLLIANRLIPHVHAHYADWRRHGGAAETIDDRLRRAVLIGGAITLHNAPEGLAMGIAFASGLEEVAFVLAVVIGVQNVPDGFAFAVPVSRTDVSAAGVFAYTTLSGFVPQVGAAIVGFALVSVSTALFPIAAGFAAGAMIGVVFREMIPSSHGHGYADVATATFLLGFVVLVVVDTILG